jgi:hypothetical protein
MLILGDTVSTKIFTTRTRKFGPSSTLLNPFHFLKRRAMTAHAFRHYRPPCCLCYESISVHPNNVLSSPLPPPPSSLTSGGACAALSCHLHPLQPCHVTSPTTHPSNDVHATPSSGPTHAHHPPLPLLWAIALRRLFLIVFKWAKPN